MSAARSQVSPAPEISAPSASDLLTDAIAVLDEAYRRGVHVDECPMLHPNVSDNDWTRCTCWYGRARKLLRAAVPRPPYGVPR